ncbi:hypothetical protein SRB5_71200 [Streptomyces sp. RB5]|uniref:Transposase IS116/IS110/IS902 C-terminal domain-containing protein n=1 Tax=Streptomyces smaragdinus TaxID=2585196 RepID=A0A7K0CTV3_9ACTN|nr:hypothetical protein [Streptomyces smaragdinus]
MHITLYSVVHSEEYADNQQVNDLDRRIEACFRRHEHAEIITSLPGTGPLLGAEFLACTGGDMTLFGTPDRLAALAGVAPTPRDSGRISGNLRRPRRYHRGLQRISYQSALISIRCCPESIAFYDRKRAEGKRHIQAVLSLARRRVNVLRALLRDGRRYEPAPPVAARQSLWGIVSPAKYLAALRSMSRSVAGLRSLASSSATRASSCRIRSSRLRGRRRFFRGCGPSGTCPAEQPVRGACGRAAPTRAGWPGRCPGRRRSLCRLPRVWTRISHGIGPELVRVVLQRHRRSLASSGSSRSSISVSTTQGEAPG